MPNDANTWTLDGFVEHFDFVHHKMLDHKYVWILGAGASFASGIPLGSQLVDEWLKEMHRRENHDNKSLEEWATSENLGIKDFTFEKREASYSQIYQRRFHDYPDEGYAYLESVMSGKDPSPGYSILAAALAEDPPRHNVVITTNFDNLVADALSIYTDTFPFVAGHESLTGFVRVSMRRPLICKIHRDLLLGPQNDPRGLKRLHDAWGTALRALFQHYTPLFIGYGGNDDTLMDLLASFQPGDIKGQMIWCYYGERKLSERINEVVADLNGVLVPSPDFDLLMVLLGERMQIGLLDQEIESRSSERTRRYRERIQKLDTIKYPSVTRALSATFERSGGWWAWVQKARSEKNIDRREGVLKQGIEQYPSNCYMCASYADFLSYARGDRVRGEEFYRKALSLAPKDPSILNNVAYFLGITGKYEEAESLFRKAVELHPNNPIILGNLAGFLFHIAGETDKAEALFHQTLELDPEMPHTYSKYASFLLGQGRLSEAAQAIETAKSYVADDDTKLQVALAFYSAILSRLNGESDSESVSKLRTLLADEVDRSPFFFQGLLKGIESRLNAQDYALFSKFAAAISDVTVALDFDQLLQERATHSGSHKSGVKRSRSNRSKSVSQKNQRRSNKPISKESG